MAKEQRYHNKVEKWKAILGDSKELPPVAEKFLLDQLFSPGGCWVRLARDLEVASADLRQERTTLDRRATVSYAIAYAVLLIGLSAVGTGVCLWIFNATGLTSAGTLVGVGALFKVVAAATFRFYARIDKRQADVSRRLDEHCRFLQAFQSAFFLSSKARERVLERVIVAHLQTA